MASEKVVPKSCVISDVKMFTFHFCHTFLVLLEVTTQGTAAMSRNYRFLWVEHCRKNKLYNKDLVGFRHYNAEILHIMYLTQSTTVAAYSLAKLPACLQTLGLVLK